MSEPTGVEQAFNILSAAHVESVIENRILRARVMQLEAKVKELTPPPEGEPVAKPLEVVK